MSTVFMAFQATEEARPIIEAIVEDNPNARVNEAPAMVRIDAEGRLIVKRSSIEKHLGREFDLQELHVSLISLSGHIEEDEDQFVLVWKN